jgi:predicted Zn-dependent protease
MIGYNDTRALLEQVLACSTADESEAVLMGLESQLTRFANNEVHQHVAETNRYVIVRVALDKRLGVVATNDLTAPGLERVVDRAITMASLQPSDPGFPGLPRPSTVAEVPGFDEATAACGPSQRVQAVQAVCRRAKEKDCVASGAYRTAIHEYAVANGHGLFVYHPATEADLTTVVMTSEDSSGYATDASWRMTDLDVPALGKEAITKALRSRSPQTVEPGAYPVVLEPYAAHDLLETLAIAAGARFVQEGRSWMSGREGERLLSPLVSIWDDGGASSAWPLPFDFEGTPRRRIDIVRNGTVGEVLCDRAQGARRNTESSGHALPAVNPFSPWLDATRFGPIPLHAVMGTGESSVQEMVAGTDRGLYITRFWYTRTVHFREAVVTGMTRDGTFLIEHGEITRPVHDLRFTQSYVKALAATEAVGDSLRHAWTEPGIRSAPALKLAAFDFTG